MVYRNDRNKNGGGVFISVRDGYTTSEINQGSSNWEIVWKELQSRNEKSVILDSFYISPNTGLETLQELRKSLENLPKNSEDKIIILAGDFNLPHINRKNNTIKPGGNQLQSHQELLDIIDEFGLEQMQTNPTRQDNVLDLYFTNIPSLVKSCETIPGISNHDMLVINSDLKPTYNKPKRRKVYIYKRADMNTIKQNSLNMTELSENIINTDVDWPINDMWEKLKHGIYEVMEKNIPSKLTSNRHNLSWINHKLKQLIKKKNKLYNKARQSKKKRRLGLLQSTSKTYTESTETSTLRID